MLRIALEIALLVDAVMFGATRDWVFILAGVFCFIGIAFKSGEDA